MINLSVREEGAMERKVVACPESALAGEIFEKFCSAQTLKAILSHFRHLCHVLQIQPTNFPHFYPKLKSKLVSWKAQALWNKFDKRASHKCYNRGRVCYNSRVLVIGAGPCGLRAAIEAQLLGAKVVVVEKRDRISRNNVLHLWPYVIHDLKGLGAKKFFGKFCAGAIDHISIRQLQYILLKVALLLGVEIHEGVGFESLSPPPPPSENAEKIGWRAIVSPADHPISQYEFDVLIGADGKRNTLDGFKRKEFRGKLAIAITANFINRRSEAEARVEEISGVAFIFNQRFFKELYDTTGIDLENIVYYKDDTHYFVMTAKKHSLIDKGVILNDYGDTCKLLSLDNVDRNALMDYAREAADFSTKYQLPCLEFAVNHYGQPDVAMFDFTSMYAAENASRVLERGGHRLLITLVGDSLLEPFWPTGSGCARGFLSSMDAGWAIRSWALGRSPLAVVAERESIYRLLAQTTPENLHRDIQGYTVDPHTRYPNLNTSAVLPIQVKSLFSSDDPNAIETLLTEPMSPILDNSLLPKKRRKRDVAVAAETVLRWLQKQVSPYEGITVDDLTSSFRDGLALCAVIHRYRPHLIDFPALDRTKCVANNQLAFEILEREFAIPPVMTGEEMASSSSPEKQAWSGYLSQVYDALRGEIPHIKHPKIEEFEDEEAKAAAHHSHRVKTLKMLSTSQKVSLLGRVAAKHHHHRSDHSSSTPRKRRSDRESRGDSWKRSGAGKDEEFIDRVKELEAKLRGSHDKKPKDLLRAIGRIEKTDWNVKEIEKKMEESRVGRGISKKTEKVPKWSKQHFEDKFSMMEKKLLGQEPTEPKCSLDTSVVLKELRGSQKVSNMARHLAQNIQTPASSLDGHTQVNGSSKGSSVQLSLPANGGGETCHICHKRVYLMERVSAEGKYFHRGCFRCHYCHTSLRLGNYTYDREGRYGHRFYCTQHFGLEGTAPGIKTKTTRLSTPRRKMEQVDGIKGAEPAGSGTAVAIGKSTPQTKTLPSGEPSDAMVADSGEGILQTPERIEFENLVDEVEVEEDEWTDRNFGQTSTDNDSSSSSSGITDSESSEEAAVAEDGGGGGGSVDPAEETLRLAQDWTRRYASDTSFHDRSPESTDSEDEESSADEMRAAREIRRLEVAPAQLHPPVRSDDEDEDSQTEIASEEYSDSESESDGDNNSATEISTDSEFEHDGSMPQVETQPTVQVRKGELEQPQQVQLVTRPLNGRVNTQPKDIKLELRKIDDWKDNKEKDDKEENKPTVQNGPRPLINPNRGDYLLNRTQSTEGIASKISLELKKKYLLGGAGNTGTVKKSGSTSILDTKLKSLIDQISEKQKMLNVSGGAEPSPTMQAVLQGADRIKAVSPLKAKQLPSYQEFRHVCALKDKEKSDDEKKEVDEVAAAEEAAAAMVTSQKLSPLAESTGGMSPVAEPRLPAINTDMEQTLEADSLSSSSNEEGIEDEQDSIEAEAVVAATPTEPEPVIHSAISPIRPYVLSPAQSPPCQPVVTDPEGCVLKRVGSTRDLEPSPPASPPTETEMSDWARDVSLEEDEDDLSAAKLPNRNRPPATLAHQEDDFAHICGKKPPDSLPLNLDNIEFMDTGGGSSSDEACQNPVMVNSGYIQFVNQSEEDELPTPLVEATNFAYLAPPEDDSKNAEFTDTTTTSDATTVRNPIGGESTGTSSSERVPQADREYEEYVQRLRGRISPFRNAKDSIGVIKRRKSGGSSRTSDESYHEEIVPTNQLAEVKEEDKPGNASPKTCRKLEELSKERSMQRELVAEMVLTKVGTGGRPRNRRSRPVSCCSITSPPPPPPPDSLPLDETPRARCISVSKLPLAASTPVSVQRSLPDIHSAAAAATAAVDSAVAAVAAIDALTSGQATPVSAAVLRCDLRQSAKAKYRMMSDEELGLSPEDRLSRIRERFNRYLSSSQEKLTINPKGDDSKKSGKETDRKRSIIQAVTDFFHKKSPSPPKTPSSHSPTKLIKFKSNRSKESLDEGSSAEPPPIPPLPESYTPHEDSWSEDEGGQRRPGAEAADHRYRLAASSTAAKALRQAHNKRLRMAQEVQRSLEEVEVRQREVEGRGVEVEKLLQSRGEGEAGGPLVTEWFDLLRRRAALRSLEKELTIRAQELELEDRHLRLQAQFKHLIATSDSKSDEGMTLEARMLREMLEVLEQKEKIAVKLALEKHRREQEDREIEAQMLAATSMDQQGRQAMLTRFAQQFDA